MKMNLPASAYIWDPQGVQRMSSKKKTYLSQNLALDKGKNILFGIRNHNPTLP